MPNQSWIFKRERFRIIEAEVIEGNYTRVFKVLQKKIGLKWKTELIEEVPLEVANKLSRNIQWTSTVEIEAKKKFGKPKFEISQRAKVA